MPTNQLAPPVIPGLFMPNIGPPNQMAPDPQAPGAANMPLQVNPMAPMSPADVYNFNAANLGDAWKAAQNPDTWRDAAQAYSQAMLAGSIGPEGKGFTAYHGSPHMFDQFDLSKIGTGEGAQAYGHGMYLADSEGVARSYRDQLSADGPRNDLKDILNRFVGESPSTDDIAGALKTTSLRDFAEDSNFINSVQQYAKEDTNRGITPAGHQHYTALQAALERVTPPGHMYEVNVNADPAKFLDWDAPLSQQHPDVQAALAKLPDDVRGQFAASGQQSKEGWGDLGEGNPSDYVTGAKVYRLLDDDPAVAAQALQQVGIPGIRYLDQGSRNAGGWHLTPPNETVSGKWMVKSNDYNSQGMHFDNEADARAALADKIGGQTRNSVVFDAATMNIIRRYGLAGLLGGGAAAAATQQPSAP